MHRLQRELRAVSILCQVAFGAGVLAILALIDIFHGESDVRLEVAMVEVAIPIVAAALLLSVRSIGKVLGTLTDPSIATPPHDDTHNGASAV
jgi:hypothetical protein